MHTLLKQTRSKTLYSPNMSPSFSCPFPVQCAGGRRPGSLAEDVAMMSGPRHLSPRSRVCAQEWHSKDIHSHIYCQTPMHTPHLFISFFSNNCKTLNSRNMMPSFTGPLPVQCAGGQRPGSLAPAPQDCSTRPSRLGQY